MKAKASLGSLVNSKERAYYVLMVVLSVTMYAAGS